MQDELYAPGKSFLKRFDNPDRFAAAIPGGRYGVLPTEGGRFQARVHVVNLDCGVAVRGVKSSAPLVIRSEFTGGPAPSITYMFPVLPDTAALLDGKEMSGLSLVSRTPGQTPQLRTFGAYELGGIVVLHETLRRAAAAFSGQEHAKLLLDPASLNGASPQKFARVISTYLTVTRLLDRLDPGQFGQAGAAGIGMLRDEVTAALIETVVSGELKRDHLASRRQTASMAKIERFIDDHRDGPVGLQGLCEETGMALRTVESIIRSRTGMSALAYVRRRHLAFARAMLLQPDEAMTVTRVAMQNGFLHLGRFSAAYREVYGETPSKTLEKVLGRTDSSAPAERRHIKSPNDVLQEFAPVHRVPPDG